MQEIWQSPRVLEMWSRSTETLPTNDRKSTLILKLARKGTAVALLQVAFIFAFCVHLSWATSFPQTQWRPPAFPQPVTVPPPTHTVEQTPASGLSRIQTPLKLFPKVTDKSCKKKTIIGLSDPTTGLAFPLSDCMWLKYNIRHIKKSRQSLKVSAIHGFDVLSTHTVTFHMKWLSLSIRDLREWSVPRSLGTMGIMSWLCKDVLVIKNKIHCTLFPSRGSWPNCSAAIQSSNAQVPYAVNPHFCYILNNHWESFSSLPEPPSRNRIAFWPAFSGSDHLINSWHTTDPQLNTCLLYHRPLPAPQGLKNLLTSFKKQLKHHESSRILLWYSTQETVDACTWIFPLPSRFLLWHLWRAIGLVYVAVPQLD